jgi:hypothetical protein
VNSGARTMVVWAGGVDGVTVEIVGDFSMDDPGGHMHWIRPSLGFNQKR